MIDDEVKKTGRAVIVAGARLTRDHAAAVLSSTTEETGKLAKSVVRSPLTQDVAAYAAVGAAIAVPLPIVGPAIGAALGAGLGLWRNMKRIGPSLAPKDPITELERLHALKEKGIITEEEFLTSKKIILKN